MITINRVLSFEEPIDTILSFDNFIFLGSYIYHDNNRSGSIYIMTTDNYKIINKINTTGTLHLFNMENVIVAVNAKDLTTYDLYGNKVNTINTKSINTYGIFDTLLFISDISGCLTIYSKDLAIFNSIKISDSPLWILYKNFSDILVGDEDKNLFKYSLIEEQFEIVYQDIFGIISISKLDSDNICISSYSDKITILNAKNYKLIKNYEDIGSLWRIKNYKEYLIATSIYDGFRVYDKTFKLIASYLTDSICYGLDTIGDNEFIFSSFYDKKVFFGTLSNNVTNNK